MANMSASDDVLRCPITFELFRDPVLAPDGHTYERHAIEQWIGVHGDSPMTRQPLSIQDLMPNRVVKDIVTNFETLLRQKNFQFTLDVDVRKMGRRPLFQATGKTLYRAEWLTANDQRPEIVLLKLDGAQARKEASFYVNLSRHPHIIRTFGFVYDPNIPNPDNTVVLLQEYASEGSLYDLLQDRQTVPDEKILIHIFLQIIEGMIYLASNHVIHGDLACRNVLIFRFDENQSERNNVKIADFGLSRHSQIYSRAPGAARTTLDICPVRYAAPEVFTSHKTSANYTEKSDVYSMGVLMWEAYSRGVVPWSNIERDEDVIRRVLSGELLPQPSNCSQPYWSIIKKTWSLSPEDRPTFNELKSLLSEQYYRSGGNIPQNINRQQHTRTASDSSARQIQISRQQQEDEDRKIARRFQAGTQEERLRTTARTERQPISTSLRQNQLDCRGRVCSTCGKCRGWYLDGRIPRKRQNGSCNAYKIDFLTAAQLLASGFTIDMRPLEENHMCQCMDNRS
ncbi:unnamed protein product [Adineta steineri]|uniref:Non-specific protein-tyrosine kinase n=1 Tax=Adineta steineri TaxID=433720 RepID=A0A815B7G8_9BILA|nr:unnamed protein product [Adineta steineri]CAF3990949.1 unnamed protein product [Adineta steineri]